LSICGDYRVKRHESQFEYRRSGERNRRECCHDQILRSGRHTAGSCPERRQLSYLQPRTLTNASLRFDVVVIWDSRSTKSGICCASLPKMFPSVLRFVPSQLITLPSSLPRDIEDKVKDLKRLAAELRRISSSCSGNRPMAECRIIEALSMP